MLSLIHQGVLLSQVSELEPARPELWARGQIVYFAIEAPPLGEDIEQAFLASPGGLIWHVEILASGPPRDPASPAGAGVIIRILHKLEATPALTNRPGDQAGAPIARFPGALQRDHSTAGAA